MKAPENAGGVALSFRIHVPAAIVHANAVPDTRTISTGHGHQTGLSGASVTAVRTVE